MHDDENGNDHKSQQMSETDMMVEFMDLMSQDGASDNKLRKILDYVERVLTEAD